MGYQLTLKNKLEDLEILSNWIDQISELLSISKRGKFRLQLITEEAVSNIIQNAYTNKGEHEIFLDLVKERDLITISLKDTGIFFNPLLYPEVELPNNLESAKEGGLGIHLIRNYTDECHYERNQNENTLVFAIRDAV